MASTARRLTAYLALAALPVGAAAACAPRAREVSTPATTIVFADDVTSSTEGRNVTFTVAPSLEPTVAPSTTVTIRTTTTLRKGLPTSFPIPPASTISLGGGSQLTNGVEIRGVEKAAIVRWLRSGLPANGWQIVRDDGTRIDFTGPGAIGAVVVDPPSAGVTLVRFALGGR